MKYLGRDPAIQGTLSSLNLGQEARDLTVIDADHPQLSDAQQIVIGHSMENGQLMNLVVEKGVRHVVQMPNQDFARQVSFTAHVMNNSKEFFENPRHHLIQLGSKSLLEGEAQCHEYHLEIPFTKKELLLEKIYQDLQGIPRSTSIRDSAVLVADEMIMNVTKDAPMYFEKNFPKQSVKNRHAKLFIAWDAQRLLIWTEDDFGSLAVDKMIGRLQECYNSEQITPLLAEGQGAGLGCKMIFDMSVSMSVLVKPGQKTVFCAVLPLGMSNRKIQGLPKNLQILTLTF